MLIGDEVAALLLDAIPALVHFRSEASNTAHKKSGAYMLIVVKLPNELEHGHLFMELHMIDRS